MKLVSVSVYILTVFTALILAHTVLLAPYGKQCFFENLKKNDELAISYQVGSRNPDNSEQYKADFHVSIMS